jgi:hypothetical protein
MAHHVSYADQVRAHLLTCDQQIILNAERENVRATGCNGQDAMPSRVTNASGLGTSNTPAEVVTKHAVFFIDCCSRS